VTFKELLTYLSDHTENVYILQNDVSIDGYTSEAFTNEYVGELVATLIQQLEIKSLNDEVVREKVVNGLGQMRLKYMADDAPVEGFRTVEKSIVTIDAAFNDEALRQKGK
jgi:hypothetical protein